MAKSSKSRKFRIIVAAIGIGVVLTTLMVILSHRRELEQQRQRFDAVSDRTAELLRSQVLAELALLSELKTPAAAMGTMKRGDFRSVASHLIQKQPGVISLTWAPKIGEQDRAFFETLNREEGYTSFQITEHTDTQTFAPSPVKDVYYPVHYFHPMVEENVARLGLNLGSDPSIEPLLRRAASSNSPQVLTSVETLPSGELRTAITVIEPVYRSSPLASPETRELSGFMVGQFDAQTVLTRVSRALGGGLSVDVFENNNGHTYLFGYNGVGKSAVLERRIYESLIENPNTPIAAVKRIELGGKQWDIVLRDEAAPKTPSLYFIITIGIQGFTVTVILILALLFVEGEVVPTKLAKKREEELRERIEDERIRNAHARYALESEIDSLRATVRVHLYQNQEMENHQLLESSLRQSAEREAERLRSEIDELQERLISATEQPTDNGHSAAEHLLNEGNELAFSRELEELRAQLDNREKKIKELELLKKGRLKITETDEYKALQAKLDQEHQVAKGLLTELTALKVTIESQKSQQGSHNHESVTEDEITARVTDALDAARFAFEDELNKKVATLEQTIEAQARTIATQIDTMTALGHELAKESSTAAELRENQESLKQSLKEKTERLALLTSAGNLDQLSSVHEPSGEVQQEQIEEYQLRVAELEAKLEENTAALELSLARQSELESIALNWQANINERDADKDGANSTSEQLVHLQNEVSRLSNIVQLIENERDTLLTELNEERAATDSLKEDNEKQQTRLAELLQQYQSLEAEFELKQTALSVESGVDNSELKTQLDTLKEELASSILECESLRALKTDTLALETQLTELTTRSQEREAHLLEQLNNTVSSATLTQEREESERLRCALEELAERVGILREQSLQEAEKGLELKKVIQDLEQQLVGIEHEKGSLREEFASQLAEAQSIITDCEQHIELLKAQLTSERTANESTLGNARTELKSQIATLEAVNDEQRNAYRELQKEYSESLRAIEREKTEHFRREVELNRQITALRHQAEESELVFERCTIQERERIQRERTELETQRIEIMREIEAAQLSKLNCEERIAQLEVELTEERDGNEALVRELRATLEGEKLSATEREKDLIEQLNLAIRAEEEIRVAFECFKSEIEAERETTRERNEQIHTSLSSQLNEARQNVKNAEQQLTQLTQRMANEQAEAEVMLAEVTDALERERKTLEDKIRTLSDEITTLKQGAEQSRQTFETTKAGLLEAAQKAREHHESVRLQLTDQNDQLQSILNETKEQLRGITRQYESEKSSAERRINDLTTTLERERSSFAAKEAELSLELTTLRGTGEVARRTIDQISAELTRRKSDFEHQKQTLTREIEKARQRIIRKKEQIAQLSSELVEIRSQHEQEQIALREKSQLAERLSAEKSASEKTLAELYAKLAAERASFALRETVLSDELSSLKTAAEEESSRFEQFKIDREQDEKRSELKVRELTEELQAVRGSLRKSEEDVHNLVSELTEHKSTTERTLFELTSSIESERLTFADRETELSDELTNLRELSDQQRLAHERFKATEAERFSAAQESFTKLEATLKAQIDDAQQVMADRASQIFTLTTELDQERNKAKNNLQELSAAIESERTLFAERETELCDEIATLRTASEEIELAFDRYRQETDRQSLEQKKHYDSVERRLSSELEQESMNRSELEEKVEYLNSQLNQERTAAELRIRSLVHSHERALSEAAQRESTLNQQLASLRDSLHQSELAYESFKEEEQRRAHRRKEQYDLYREQLTTKLDQARETLSKREERISQLTSQLSLEKTLSEQRLQTLREELSNSFDTERAAFQVRQDELDSELSTLRELVAQSEYTIQSLQDDLEVRSEERESGQHRLILDLEQARRTAQLADERISLLTLQLEEERANSESRLLSFRQELNAEHERRTRSGTDHHKAFLQLQRDYLEASRSLDQLRKEVSQRELNDRLNDESRVESALYDAERRLNETLRSENVSLQEQLEAVRNGNEGAELIEVLESRVKEQEDLIEHLQTRIQTHSQAASGQLETRLRENNTVIARLKEERDAERLRGEQLEELVRELRTNSRTSGDDELVQKLMAQIRELEQVQDEQLSLIASLSKRTPANDSREREEQLAKEESLRAELESEHKRVLSDLNTKLAAKGALVEALTQEREELGARIHRLEQRKQDIKGEPEHEILLENFRSKLGEQSSIIESLQAEVWKLRQVSDQSRTVQQDLERKVAERAAALAASEARYKTLTQITPAGIFYTDPEGRFVFANEYFVQLCGAPFDQLRGEGWLQLVHQDDRALVARRWKKAIRDRERFSAEFRFQYYDGSIKWVIAQAAVEGNDEGEESGFVGTIMDTTDKKRPNPLNPLNT